LNDPSEKERSPSNTLNRMDKSPTMDKRKNPKIATLKSDPSFQSFQFVSKDEVDSAFAALKEDEDTSHPSRQDIIKVLKKNTEMNKIRSQFEDHLECLDTRLEHQKSEVADIQDYFKRRAEIEKKYSKELEALTKYMLNKHRETLRVKDAPAPSSTAILKELVKETKKTGRNHAVLEDIFGTEISSRCNSISNDISRVYKQCRDAGLEIQENVLGVLFELHTKTKIFQQNKDNYLQAQKKLTDAQKDIDKIEKEIPKQEKREKNNRYIKAQKVLETRTVRHEDTHMQAIKSHNEYILSVEATNAALKKYYKDDISDLIDCMDLGFHHRLKNMLQMRSSAIENIISSEREDIEVMEQALGSLDSRRDKANFLESHAVTFSPPDMFELKTNKSLEPSPEEMDTQKRSIQDKIEKLRGLSEYTAKVIEDDEAELLLIFNQKNYDMTSLFDYEKDETRKEETGDVIRHKFEERLIENNKRLITTNNRIEQEEAKYQNLKKSLVAQQFAYETLPRPHPKKRRKPFQTSGLPKIFGGSLDDYYEATGEKIPLVIESCIRTINLFGMRHQGIFRITGSHVDINKFEETFEKGEDPFACMTDGNHINSVSGVLKSYFRKLKEPLFSEEYFDQFMNITKIGSDIEFVLKAQEIVKQWSEPHIVVTRFLFSFLKDLSQFSEETQMDPWNIAICFGPNLCPIPEGKDLVQHTNLVNDLIKNFIIFCDDIFQMDIDGPVYINVDLDNSNDDQVQDEIAKDVAEPKQDLLQKGAFEDKPKPKPEEAVALYDYKAGTEKELSFNKGDQLLLFSKANEHWWLGSKGGDQGLIPAQYFEISTRPREMPALQSSITEKLETFKAQRPTEDKEPIAIHEEEEGIITKHMSFKSNRSMWETKTLERSLKKTTPDLVQDILDKTNSKDSRSPSMSRNRSDSNINARRMSKGQDVPDGIIAGSDKPLGKVKPMAKVAPANISDNQKEDIIDTAV